MRRIKNSITTKILLLLVIIMLSMFSFITFVYLNRTSTAFDSSTETLLSSNSKVMKEVIASLMLIGDPTPLSQLINSIKESKEIMELKIIRQDGSYAFQDENETYKDLHIPDGEFLNIQEIESDELILYKKENFADFYSPITLEQSCLQCHKGKVGTVKAVTFFRVSTEFSDKIQNTTLSQMLIIFLSSAIAMIGIIFIFLKRNIIQPIKHLKRMFSELSNGKLSLNISSKFEDEIGELFGAYNKFVDYLRAIISKIKNVTTISEDLGSDLQDATGDTVSELDQIVNNLGNVNNEICTLVNEVSMSSKGTDEIRNQGGLVYNATSKQIKILNDSIDSLLNIFSSIEDLAQKTEVQMSTIVKLKLDTNSGMNSMKLAEEKIKEMAEESERVNNLVNLVDEISEKTNLLAINASIEAAHSGVYGKGFAVIAKEIKNLAQTSSLSARDIQVSLQTMLDSISETVDQTKDAGQIFKMTQEKVDELSVTFDVIKTSSRKISDDTVKIRNELKLIQDSGVETSNASKEIENTTIDFKKSMESIQSVADHLQKDILKMNSAVNNVYENAKSVSNTGHKNIETVGEMDKLISHFTIEQ